LFFELGDEGSGGVELFGGDAALREREPGLPAAFREFL